MTLFEIVKTMQDRTSDDSSNDEKIRLVIEDAKTHLLSFNPLLTDEDFKNPTKARRLAVNYCRYAMCNADEEFDANYKHELLALRRDYEVKAYVTKKEET